MKIRSGLAIVFTGLLSAAMIAGMGTKETLASSGSCDAVRATFDVGSSSTKMKVAEIDMCKHKIIKILLTDKVGVKYTEDLQKHPGSKEFSGEIKKAGIDAFQKLKAEAAKFNPDMYVGVATQAFRDADYVDEYVDRILRETGVSIKVLRDQSDKPGSGQRAEGLLELTGVAASRPDLDLQDIVSLGIGGGSLQIGTIGPDRKLIELELQLGSDKFKELVIKNLKHSTVEQTPSPNPIGSDKDGAIALASAALEDEHYDSTALAKLIEKIKDRRTVVVGVGGVQNDGLKPFLTPKGEKPADFYSTGEVGTKLEQMAAMGDDQLGPAPAAGKADFRPTMVTNLALVYGILEKLKARTVDYSDVNLADGLLFSTDYDVDKPLPLNQAAQAEKEKEVAADKSAGTPSTGPTVAELRFRCDAMGKGNSTFTAPNPAKKVRAQCMINHCIPAYYCDVSNNGAYVMAGTNICVASKTSVMLFEQKVCAQKAEEDDPFGDKN